MLSIIICQYTIPNHSQFDRIIKLVIYNGKAVFLTKLNIQSSNIQKFMEIYSVILLKIN